MGAAGAVIDDRGEGTFPRTPWSRGRQRMGMTYGNDIRNGNILRGGTEEYPGSIGRTGWLRRRMRRRRESLGW